MSRSRIRSTTAAVLLFFAAFSSALEVAPDSPCASKCLDNPKTGNATDRDDSLTFNPDIACFDWEYVGSNSTQVGQKFKDCQNCLKGSRYSDTTSNERDTTWFLFNNRAAVDWCIFGRFAEESDANISKSTINQQCNNKCQAIYTAADYHIKSDPGSYDFCDNDGNFASDAESCLTCLHDQQGLTILGNILTTVVELCKKKPGKAINFLNNAEIYAATQMLFSSNVARSNSSSNSSISSTNSTNSTSPNNSTNSTDSTNSPTSSSSSSSSGLSTGAIAGAALGGLVLIAVFLGGILLLLRRKKNKNKAAELSGGSYNGTHQYGQVPQSARDVYDQQAAERAHAPTDLGGQSAPMELTVRSSTPPGARR